MAKDDDPHAPYKVYEVTQPAPRLGERNSDSNDDASDRRVIEAMAACEYARSLAEFNANNALSLRRLRDAGKVKI
jgi:hypothetical protein